MAVPPPPPPRVVSLLPAATEIVAALGAGSWLVGVSHECDYPAEVTTLPRVTRSALDPALPSGAIQTLVAASKSGAPLVTIDVDLLRRLNPDLIIGQALCDVCAVGENLVAQALPHLSRRPEVVTLHAHTLNEVLTDIVRVGAALDLKSEADELVAGLRYRLRSIPPSHVATPPRLLVVEWTDPPYVAGHWVPELIAAAGGTDVGSAPGAHSRARPWKDLRALAPDLILVSLCGFDVPRARQEVAQVDDPDGQALLAGRTMYLDGNAYTSRPGPRLVDAAELIAQQIGG
ncbi:MAG TPA: ABC transporter substrate-binding protein [Gemmatimonadales bacterium]|jgi:iron complex transport system substrate-binding protein|nr:ABC transporter substrate-binding protein [Gemmatimonadales bacterium]